MYSLITKSAVLLSILILLSLASASAELKRVPLILMDRGSFEFRPNMPIADLKGDGVSTHLGNIVSTGVFESLGPGPPQRFKGKIEGTATVAVADTATATSDETATGETAEATSDETATATASETATSRARQDSITYRLSAEFRPDASGIFYGMGTYVITGGTGKFKRAKGFGEFIGLADLPPGSQSYNCFLRGVISY
jgi:hypothetical protein